MRYLSLTFRYRITNYPNQNLQQKKHTANRQAQMWKKLNKQKYKDIEPQILKNSATKSSRISGQSQEIDKNLLLAPKVESKSSKRGKCKIGIDEIDQVMVGISEADVDKQTDSRLSKNFTPVLENSLGVIGSNVVVESQQLLREKVDNNLSNAELGGLKVPNTDTKQKIANLNSDIHSHHPQSSKYNSSQQDEQPSNQVSQFKSFSLGRAKPNKILKEVVQPIQQSRKQIKSQWNQSEPVIIYSQKDINQDQHLQVVNRNLEQDEGDEVIQNQNQGGMDMEDFFNQMREAGIDISDLQSNKSRADMTIQFDQSPTFKRTSSEKKEIKQQHEKQPFCIQNKMFQFDNQQHIQKQDNKQQEIPNRAQIIVVQESNQLKKTKIKGDTVGTVNVLKIRGIFRKIIQQMHCIKQIRQELQQNMISFEKKKEEINKEIQKQAQGLSQMYKKLKMKLDDQQKSKLSKHEHNKVTEQLRYKILELQAEILEKQVIISRQAEQIQEYRFKNQQLNESLFDKNQRIAQNQLIINKKVNEIIENIGIKQVEVNKQKSNHELLVQIQRLSEEVEEITRLYHNSQQQHNNVIQKQKVAFTLEMEKNAKKQASWHQKQQILEQKARKLESQQANLSIQKERIIKRQQQLDIMEKKLEEKIMQVQKLQIELNQGFAFLEQAKQQNAQYIERVEAEKEQSLAEAESLKKKIYYLEQQIFQHKEKQAAYEKNKQKSIISSLYEQENRSRQLDDRTKNGFGFDKNRMSTEFTSKNDKKVRFQTSPYSNVEEEFEDYYPPIPNKNKFNHHFCQINDDEKSRRPSQRNTDRFLEGVKLINSKKEYRDYSPYTRPNDKYLSQVVSSTQSLNPYRPKIIFLKQQSNREIKDSNIRSLKARYDDSKSKITLKKQSPIKKSNNDRKLNELDSKIENLRSEIKREIISAKQN